MVRTNAEVSQVGRNRTWQDCLNAIANVLPEFMGGSADLAPSNMTLPLRQEDFKMFHVVDHYQSATAYSFTTFKHEAAMRRVLIGKTKRFCKRCNWCWIWGWSALVTSWKTAMPSATCALASASSAWEQWPMRSLLTRQAGVRSIVEFLAVNV